MKKFSLIISLTIIATSLGLAATMIFAKSDIYTSPAVWLFSYLACFVFIIKPTVSYWYEYFEEKIKQS